MSIGLVGRVLVMLLSLVLNGCAIPVGQMSPLHVAASRGDAQAVRDWIARGDSLNSTYGDYTVVFGYSESEGSRVRNKTALMFASQYGHFEVAKLLIDAGADIYVIESNARGDDRGNAFERALSEGHVEIAKYIWDKADKARLVPRLRSYHFGQACVKTCTTNYGTNTKDNLALAIAGSLSQAELGIGIGALPCTESWRSSLSQLQFLLQSGIVFPTNTLQCIAASAGYTKDGMAIAKLFLDQGADPNYLYTPIGEPFSVSALMMAASSANPELVALLLARGASPFLRNRWDETPLMYAMNTCFGMSDLSRQRQQLQVIAQLLSAGSDIGARDRNGRTVATRGVAPTCCSLPNPSSERTKLCRLIRGEQHRGGQVQAPNRAFENGRAEVPRAAQRER